MSPPTHPTPDDPAMAGPAAAGGPARARLGVGLMALAMLTIPAADGLAKHLSVSGGYSAPMIGWGRYAVASLIVLPLAAAVHGVRVLPVEARLSHLLRTVFLVSAMTLYFLAIARIPLAMAASAYFIGPVAAVVLAVPLLGERMTWRKGVSLALGVAGALAFLRPGTAAPSLGVALALGAGLLFALYLIATRQAAQRSDPLQTLVFQCVVGAVLLTPVAALFWTTPAWGDLGLFAALGLVSAASHLLSIIAFRYAEASTLAPLVYLELIGAALIGYAVFGELPDLSTVVGTGLVIAAGLVLLRR